MGRLTPLLRISLGLAMLTLSLIVAADMIFGLSPEYARPVLESRKELVESMAIQYSSLATRGDFDVIGVGMRAVVERTPDVLSAALRHEDGRLLAQAGDHQQHWRPRSEGKSTPTHALVPIFDGARRWGSVEVRFVELRSSGLAGLFFNPFARALVFVAFASFGAYLLYMRKALRHLDPSSVIPARVKGTLDVLAEGVVLVDAREQVVLANAAFCLSSGVQHDSMLGRPIGSLEWQFEAEDVQVVTGPWTEAMASGVQVTGRTCHLLCGGSNRVFVVNSAPILDERKRARGAITTFDDVTDLEAKNVELSETVALLQRSRRDVEEKNERLEILATRDALTNCINRRALIETLETEFERARRMNVPLGCVMLDIDHFKAVNDRFGHVAGDETIKLVADTLHARIRSSDALGRYGGEEFCLLLPETHLTHCAEIAEGIRVAVEQDSKRLLDVLGGEGVTISLGVASLEPTVDNAMGLVQLADEALYVAKNGGRNRVSCHESERALEAMAG